MSTLEKSLGFKCGIEQFVESVCLLSSDFGRSGIPVYESGN